MSAVIEQPLLKSQGLVLEASENRFGYLRSSDLADDVAALNARIEEDGYLYLPGLLNREEVVAARLELLKRASAEGLLDPAYPLEQGILKQGTRPYFKSEYAQENPALLRVLYDGPMMACFTRLFGEPVRHFDFTWLRAVGPGKGTAPHCDIVYMGRGTHDLYTAWTPFGDIPLSVGGLMVLENSHRRTDALGDYLRQDVDTYCANGPNVEAVRSGQLNWEHWDGSFGAWDGSITHNPVALRNDLQGRWLTCPEYRMGDVLIFTMSISMMPSQRSTPMRSSMATQKRLSPSTPALRSYITARSRIIRQAN